MNPINTKISLMKNPYILSRVFFRLILLIILSIIWYTQSELINSSKILYNSMYLLYYYLLLNIIFNYGKLATIYLYLKKNKLPIDSTDNFTVGIQRLAFFLNHFIFILIAIDVVVIKLQSLLTSLSLVAVALVLIFKEYIANFLNGLNLMFSKDFRINDIVKFGDNKGKIVDFTFHNVQLKTDSGNIIYIPNSTFLTKDITNFSRTSLKNLSIEITLAKSDLQTFEKNKLKIQSNLFKDFSDNLSNNKDITYNYTKSEKDTVEVTFEINLSKYNVSIEKLIKSKIIYEINFILNSNKKITKKLSKKD